MHLFTVASVRPMGSFYNPGGSGGSGAVTSVNGQTGIVVLNAADVGALPIGTPTQGLKSYASIIRTTDQNIAPNTETPLSFDTIQANVGGLFNALAPTRFTAQVSGLYLINGNVAWEPEASIVATYIVKNGALWVGRTSDETNTRGWGQSVSGVVPLAINDYVELYVFTSADRDIIFNAGLTPQSFSIMRIDA